MFCNISERVARSAAVLFTSFLLLSCATAVDTIQNDAVPLTKNKGVGYVLIGIDTNESLQSIFINGPRSIKLSEDDLKSGSNYLLFDLEPGRYFIEDIRISNYYEFNLEDEELWSIEVKANQINYVGDLQLKINYGYLSARMNLELVNRSSYALQFMEAKFPTILSNFTLGFGGAGEDIFLEHVSSQAAVMEVKP